MGISRGHFMDIVAARETLEAMSKQASLGCGQVYELYAGRFSEMVEANVSAMSEEGKKAFIELATKEFDYYTPEQRAEQKRLDAEMGLCSHGLDGNTCPCGCFE